MLFTLFTIGFVAVVVALGYGVWLLVRRLPIGAFERQRRVDLWTRGSVVGDSFAMAATGVALGALVAPEMAAAGGTSSCGGGAGTSGAGCGGSGGGCGGAGCGSGGCGGSGCGGSGCGGSGCGGGGCGGGS